MTPASDALETPRLTTEAQVMFFDTDCGGVVHNMAYLRLIETCRTLLAEQLGMNLAEMATTQLYPVVARTEIDYRRPARLADRLAIHGWLEEVGRARFWCGFTIDRPADGTRIVDCRQSLALVQMPEGRLVRLPPEWMTRYAHLRKKAG